MSTYRDRLDPEQAYRYDRRHEAAAQGKKWCIGCDEIKELKEFYLRKRPKGSYSRHSTCKLCSNQARAWSRRQQTKDPKKQTALQQAKAQAEAQGKKLCRRCMKAQPPSKFYRFANYDPKQPTKRLYSYCTDGCHTAVVQEWRDKNRATGRHVSRRERASDLSAR